MAQESSQPAHEPRRDRGPSEPFGYCLNTSTISGANLGIVEVIGIAAKAGYDAIEPWMREIETYEKAGGQLSDLRKCLADSGLRVPDAIGFDEWIVDDDARRAKGLEGMKRDMAKVAEIGGTHIAAPPVGARPGRRFADCAGRCRGALCRAIELGQSMGVRPIVELWGFSKNLSRLGEVAYVAIESHRPDAAMLLDIYHLYKGGSAFSGLSQINGAMLPLLHINDYPATPDRQQITDAHRVYPGDGALPLSQIFQTLHVTGFRGFLSLELFNREYWKQSPAKVAAIGLEKRVPLFKRQ